MSGFPSFDAVEVQRIDYVMMLAYMFCGCVLAYFYETTHTVTGIIAGKIPGVVKEILVNEGDSVNSNQVIMTLDVIKEED